jgi:HD-GYP domain-containing protein (c-di-GMP phosphodiesterase class II)
VLRITVDKLRPGMKLALPVANPRTPSRTLLRGGYELDKEMIARLAELEVRQVWVGYPSLAFLRSFLSPEVLTSQGKMVKQIAVTFQHMQKEATAKLDYDAYTRSIGDLVNQLVSNPKAAVFLGDLDHAVGGAELMRHSSAVTYLSVLMGLKLEGYLVKQRRHIDPGKAKEVVSLGLGAMLHDIGITLLDPAVRKRHDETGDESDADWREHPWLGYQHVRGAIEPSAATVVLNHHQRYDGTGYAGQQAPQLAERSIHIFARIAAAADAFDRLANPPNLPKQPTVWALGALVNTDLRLHFDANVLHALLAVTPPYAPGSIVKLNDERHAVVIDHNAHDPCRPMVQLLDAPPAKLGVEDVPLGPAIDLSEVNARLAITEHEGVDVSELNFKPPQFNIEAALI